MQTIATKLLPATNRVKATASGGKSITIKQSQLEAACEQHACAALALMKKLHWGGRMIGGHTPYGMVWVFDYAPNIVENK